MQISLPESWEAVDITPELANAHYIARGTPGYRNFSPNLVITRDGSVSFPAFEWNVELLNLASQDIPSMKILDLGAGTLLGLDTGVSLSTFTAEFTNVTQLQFALVIGTVGYVLTFTCATAEFPEWNLRFIDIAQSFVPEEAN